MSDLVIPRTSTLRNGVQKRLLPVSLEVGPYMLIVFFVSFIVLMSVITLIFSTKEVTKGYKLKDLESKRNVLVKESQVKQMHLAEVQSLDVLRSNPKLKGMIRPSSIVYLRGDSAVALK